jgi:hypothetical protein
MSVALRVSACEGVEDELAVIGAHQRIDDSDTVSRRTTKAFTSKE